MKTCKVCDGPIPASRWDRKDRPRIACSIKCRQILNGRQNKGALRGVNGRDHPKFKTGTCYDKNGYRKVLVGDHPFPRKTHYMREHIKVMEAHIGRRLHPNECVHHVNHKITDNRLENLRLMTKSEHSKLHRRQNN